MLTSLSRRVLSRNASADSNSTRIHLSSDDVLNLKALPQKIVIAGSGAIGIEWARIFSSFGVEVSIVEIADKLLPLADAEISERLLRTFKMARIKTFLATSIKEIKIKKSRFQAVKF